MCTNRVLKVFYLPFSQGYQCKSSLAKNQVDLRLLVSTFKSGNRNLKTHKKRKTAGTRPEIVYITCKVHE